MHSTGNSYPQADDGMPTTAGVAPGEGPLALISTDVHARATHLGAGHPAPLRCAAVAVPPRQQVAERGPFEGLGRGSMGMNV